MAGGEGQSNNSLVDGSTSGPTSEPAASPASSTWGFGRLRSSIYDSAIVSFTAKWYATVLNEVPAGSRVLDVGIGTGAALVANADLIRLKNLTIVGVDYDDSYITRCNELIVKNRLSENVSAVCCSFYDYSPPDSRLFDHVYFSGSFMIMPDAPGALRKAVELLRDREDGRIFFTQTFELKKNSLLEWMKPKLAYWTTIDFGNVTYVEDFDAALHEGGAISVRSVKINDGKAVEGTRESRLVIARSSMYVPVETTSET